MDDFGEAGEADDEAGDDETTVIWEPQVKQSEFISCPIDDVGFGGARGGGKTDAVIGDWLSHEDLYGQDAIGLAFRRERTQLVEMIERARQILVPIGHKWHDQDKYFRGPKGGRLRFSYLERDADADAFQGHSYSRLYPEEMGTFPAEGPINKLGATLRSGNGVPCQMKGTCNPGGPGHGWVKARYRLDRHPQGYEPFTFDFRNPFTGKLVSKTRVFIPSRVTDNRFLGDDYVAGLQMSGSEALVRAWLLGDWDVIEGAFFDSWRADRHIVEPFVIPDHWIKARSFDWGFASPFSVGWWAVASEATRLTVPARDPSLPPLWLPRGGLVRFAEWYGGKKPGEGMRLQAVQIADGIKYLESGLGIEKIDLSVADTGIFDEVGASHGVKGPSIAEQMARAGVKFQRADKRRHQGWDQMRGRMVGDGDGNPMMVVTTRCTDFIRSVPVLQHDLIKPEDLDTDGDDHVADESRYMAMARPWTAKSLQKREEMQGVEALTLNRMFEEREANDRRFR